MITKLVIASNNKKKIKEIKELLKDINLEIKSLSEENIDIDVVEDGETFEENSKKKAVEIKDFLLKKGDKNFAVLADDSGLEVDALNGAPGVYSARYAGEHGNDNLNNEKLLSELKGVPFDKRGAKFVSHLSIVDFNGNYTGIRGEVLGTIIENLDGEGGFGYDPLFYCPIINKTFGVATSDEKNAISHRGVAMKKMKEIINDIIK